LFPALWLIDLGEDLWAIPLMVLAVAVASRAGRRRGQASVAEDAPAGAVSRRPDGSAGY
jgi:hypothetical protein